MKFGKDHLFIKLKYYEAEEMVKVITDALTALPPHLSSVMS